MQFVTYYIVRLNFGLDHQYPYNVHYGSYDTS